MSIFGQSIFSQSVVSSGGTSSSQQRVCSNRNFLPYTTSNSANYVRHSLIKHTVPSSANWRSFQVVVSNWGQNSASEFQGTDNIQAKVGILYNGTVYQTSSFFLGAGQDVRLDLPPALTVDAASLGADQVLEVILRTEGSSTANVARLGGHGTQRIFNEGSASSTNVSDDLTDFVFGRGATAGTVTIDGGGNITAVAVAEGGSGYTAGKQVRAWQVESDGTITQQLIGLANRTGDAITSITVGGGGGSGSAPASGAWLPSVNITIQNDLANTTEVHGIAALMAIPDRTIKTVGIIGDSIATHQGSTDGVGDSNRNFGIYERGMDSRIPFINLATASQTALNFKSQLNFPRTWRLIDELNISDSFIALGTNDLSQSRSAAQVTTDINAIKSQLLDRGVRSDVATILPRFEQGLITGVTKANPAVVTVGAGHSYVNGDTVYIDSSVGGMTQIRSLQFTIANVTATTFELVGIDSTSYGTYTSGGLVASVSDSSHNPNETGFPADANTINSDIRDGTIVSDNGFIDGRAIYQDASSTNDWNKSAIWTDDLTHPNDLGLGAASQSSVLKAYFNQYVP